LRPSHSLVFGLLRYGRLFLFLLLLLLVVVVVVVL
jgi:hypothetical protein